MPKVKRIIEQEDGWSEWIQPRMENYRFICCDCGLAHDLTFRVPKVEGKYRVQFKARRNNRSTSQMRRKNGYTKF